MRTRVFPLALAAATAASALAFAPASIDGATATPAADCADTAGRELLTLEGLSLDVAAPGVTAPELAATADVTGNAISPHRTAAWLTTVDAAPYAEAKLTVTITWDDAPGDYDLYGYTYTQGVRHSLGVSNESNIDGGDTRTESFTATVADCQLVDLEVRSWAANPGQIISFEATMEPIGEASADVGARGDDPRATLYFAGDRPGNATTPADTAGADYPLGATFSPDRPTSNVPNLITHAAAGSTIQKNPVQPWWAGELDMVPTVQGTPSALVWLSSATQQDDPGTVYVQLFLNGAEHTVEIPGSELTADVKPFIVEFPEVDTQVLQYSLQVSAMPIASPNAASEHTGDANHTVWYDSVQYTSRLFLPLAEG
jgi:hypothetical protein